MKQFFAVLAVLLLTIVCSPNARADQALPQATATATAPAPAPDYPPVYKPEASITMMLTHNISFRQMYGWATIKDSNNNDVTLTARTLMGRLETACDDALKTDPANKQLQAAKAAFNTLQKTSHFGNRHLKNLTLYQILLHEPDDALTRAYDKLKELTQATAPILIFPTRKLSTMEKEQLESFLVAGSQGGLGDFTLEALCETAVDENMAVAKRQVDSLLAGRASGILPQPCDLVVGSPQTWNADECCSAAHGYTCVTGSGLVCTMCPAGRCCMGISQFCP